MMMKRQCVCGEWDGVTLEHGKAGKVGYYIVFCPGCGRQTVKYRRAEDAIKAWNHMEDGKDEQ